MYSDKLNQKFSYEVYYLMTEDGNAVRTTRKECFAPGEPVTQDNPYPQRWFYSTDRHTAIRLPRNELGEMYHRDNQAELQAEYRSKQKALECVGQRSGCSVTCESCRLRDGCKLKAKENNGKGCRRKCDLCAKFEVNNISLDYTVDEEDRDDAGFSFELADERVDVQCEATKQDILELLGTIISDRDLEVCAAILATDKEKDAAALLGITPDGFYFRKKKLSKNENLKNLLKNS